MRSGGPFVVSLRRSRDVSSMAALGPCAGGVVEFCSDSDFAGGLVAERLVAKV